MKRFVLKSLFILSVLGAITLLAGWAISLPYEPKSAQLAFGREPAYVCMALGKGDLILCDHFDNREVLNLIDRSRGNRELLNLSDRSRDNHEVPNLMDRSLLTKEQRKSFPGFHFRRLVIPSGLPNKDGQTIWAAELSLLIPCLVLITVAGVSGWRLHLHLVQTGVRNSVHFSVWQKWRAPAALPRVRKALLRPKLT